MSAKKKILIVVESIDVNDSSGSKGRVAYIRNLRSVGFEVRVLHYTRKDINIDGIECISISERKFNYNYLLSRLRRVVIRNFGKDIFRKTEGRMGFSFAFKNDSKSIAQGIKRNFKNEDLIITMSKGASFRTHHAMLRIEDLHSIWASYIHDPYPFHLYPKPYDWIEQGYKKKEQFFREVSEKAAISIFPSRLLKEWMGKFFPNLLKTGVIIPHQLTDEPIKTDIDLPEFFDASKFNLLHSGNLMKPRNPSGLIKAIELFFEQNPESKKDLKLILLGKADYFKKYLKDKQRMHKWLYANLAYLDFDTVQAIQASVSVNVIIEAKADISPFLPGKFPHCIKANKPILALGPKQSEVRRLLGHDYEYSSAIDDVEKIRTIISKLYSKWKNGEELRLNRKDIETYLSKENLKDKMNIILNKIA